LSSTRPTDRVNLSQFAEKAIGCKKLPDGEVIEMDDSRYKIAAVEMDDLRSKSLLSGVTIEMEDRRCKSLINRVVPEAEDYRCNHVAMKMEDPRCQNLSMIW
jgi:ribosome-associated protein YbcJ (S4-like RNA binding protein)